MQLKPFPERRFRGHQNELRHGQRHGRTLSARRYVDLARQPRLKELPRRRPPYLEAAATAIAFIFLLYLTLGGA
jgi:hypothetical protein